MLKEEFPRSAGTVGGVRVFWPTAIFIVAWGRAQRRPRLPVKQFHPHAESVLQPMLVNRIVHAGGNRNVVTHAFSVQNGVAYSISWGGVALAPGYGEDDLRPSRNDARYPISCDGASQVTDPAWWTLVFTHIFRVRS